MRARLSCEGVPVGEPVGQTALLGVSGLRAKCRGNSLTGCGAARAGGVEPVSVEVGLKPKFVGVGRDVKSEPEDRRTSLRMGAKGQTLRRQAVVFASLGVKVTGVGEGDTSSAEHASQSVGGARSTLEAVCVGWDGRSPCSEARVSLRTGAYGHICVRHTVEAALLGVATGRPLERTAPLTPAPWKASAGSLSFFVAARPSGAGASHVGEGEAILGVRRSPSAGPCVSGAI
mmetsp:Transcript_17025/g.37503  ORF Transcript_17025/g.37503 Transcript_17025/m.37503 type:complete len:231 (-) Transcript_17025:28-720(-)